MGWIGAALTRNFGSALLAIQVMEVMEPGPRGLESLTSLNNPSPSDHG